VEILAMTARLFESLSMRSLTLPNRVVIAPMCQYSAVDGRTQPWHAIHLGQLALGNPGLLIMEATAVEPRGRISPGCVGLYDDASEESLAQTVRDVRSVSATPLALQLGHAGRKASSSRPWEGGKLLPVGAGGWERVAPSAIPVGEDEPSPTALTREDLEALIAAFVDATRRAERIGFDAIELHAAHGYLLHQFLSPIANQREDEYGGALAHRMRFPLEVIAAVRAAWPAHKPLGVRISATDWIEGSGWDVPQAVEFSKLCAQLGVDWMDVSSGGVSPRQQIRLGPGYQVPFAEAVRSGLSIPVMAVGLITDAQQAEAILSEGKADLIGIARAALYDPRWVWRAAEVLGGSVDAARQYWRCTPRGKPVVFGEIRHGQR
jgi:2,4-dienoyl-CoA reductase-like NADH-dependent reductase (Old Yellow Enzyme family)